MTFNIKQKIAAGFALGPIILIIVGWISYTSTAELLSSQQPIVHTYEVIRTGLDFESSLREAQAASRGYGLTGNPQFLETQRNATGDADSLLQKITELTIDNPSQQARIQSLKTAYGQRKLLMSRLISARDSGGMAGAAKLLQEEWGPQVSAEMSSILHAMEQEETRLLATRTEASRNTADITFKVILWGTGLSVVLLGLFGFFLARSITVPVREAVDALASASAEILAGTTQQAAGMREQSAAVSETITTVDEVLKTSEQAAQRAQGVADSAQKAVEVSDVGLKAVEDTILVMDTVRDQTSSIAEKILNLAEQAQAISDIIVTVNEIAEQTNLLALNAAIEASRAGEHGRGFNVVASEIKALADQSKGATAQVRKILGDIQASTNKAVMATEDGVKRANHAIATVKGASNTIKALAETITEAAQAAVQIAASAMQQNTGMAQIHQAMSQVNQAASQNLAATRQSEQAAHNLTTLGGRLKEMVTGRAA